MTKHTKETKAKISKSMQGVQNALGNSGGGRPTSFQEDFPERMDQYLASCQDVTKTTPFGTKTIPNIPSIAGLSIELKVSRKSIERWYADFVKKGDGASDAELSFCRSLESILAEQEKRLLNCGLGGQYNANIAKLLLGNHGYRDKQDHTSDGEKMSAFGLGHAELKKLEEEARLDKSRA